jgi:hypothetical protein
MITEQTLADSYQLDDNPSESVHFDVDGFDNAIDKQGVSFVHFRAMPCPVGLSDRYDIRRTHEDHSGCSNGFLYQRAGKIVCPFSGNSKQVQLLDVGILTGSAVQITVPRHYTDKPGESVMLSQFDRLYLADNAALVIAMQRFEANATGLDRLQYPVVEVEHIVDSNGRSYDHTDYTIESGMIRWTGANRPAPDPKTGKGQICSIRYRYIPYWYVDRLIHEIRVVQATNPETGIHGTVRMPYAALIQRENVFENEQNDPQAPNPDSPRQAAAPRRGSFGAR